MNSRRQFLRQLVVSGIILPITVRSGVVIDVTRLMETDAYVLRDGRYRHSIQFAQEYELKGYKVVDIGADVTPAWLQLDALVRRGQLVTAAGLTLCSSMDIIGSLFPVAGRRQIMDERSVDELVGWQYHHAV